MYSTDDDEKWVNRNLQSHHTDKPIAHKAFRKVESVSTHLAHKGVVSVDASVSFLPYGFNSFFYFFHEFKHAILDCY